jgi:hypothetical protein
MAAEEFVKRFSKVTESRDVEATVALIELVRRDCRPIMGVQYLDSLLSQSVGSLLVASGVSDSDIFLLGVATRLYDFEEHPEDVGLFFRGVNPRLGTLRNFIDASKIPQPWSTADQVTFLKAASGHRSITSIVSDVVLKLNSLPVTEQWAVIPQLEGWWGLDWVPGALDRSEAMKANMVRLCHFLDQKCPPGEAATQLTDIIHCWGNGALPTVVLCCPWAWKLRGSMLVDLVDLNTYRQPITKWTVSTSDVFRT